MFLIDDSKTARDRLLSKDHHETAVLILLTVLCVGATWYFHFILHSGVVFTHLFYPAIVLAGLWWGRPGAWVGVLLGASLMASQFLSGMGITHLDCFLRSVMFVVVGLTVGILSEQGLRSEKNLRQTRDYLDSLIRYANAPIIVWNPEGRITRFNHAFERLTGHTAHQVIGQKLRLLFPEASRDQSLRKIARTLSGEHWESVEIPILCQDGETRLALWNSANIYAEDGTTLLATTAQGTDITERKRMEEALLESEERYRRITEAVTDYIFTVRVEDGRPVETAHSPASVAVTGYHPEEFALNPYLWIRMVPEKDRAAVLEQAAHVLSGQQVEPLEHCIVRKDGVTRWIRNTLVPHYDTQGQLLSYDGVIRDITERVWAEEALRKSEARFRELFDEAPVGYHELDTEGRITRVNRTELHMLGYTAEEMVGRPVWEFITQKEMSRQTVEAKMSGTIPPGRAFERTYRRKDGTTLPVLIEDHPLQDERGQIIGMRSTIQDITDRKRAEEALKKYSERLEEMVEERTKELREAQEQLIRQEKLAVLGQLAGGVGHELRNPLGAIKNAAYFLNMVLEEPEPEVKETLEILEKEVATSERIISSLLDFARSKPPTRRKMDINYLLQGALSRAAAPENVEVVSQLDDTLPTILADPDQLRQVFGNIILNAIQAMPDGGRLMVRTLSPSPPLPLPPSPSLLVSISDTGVGIPEENLDKIFEPLFTTRAKGIGLGLPIVRTLVEGHGGTIEVQSPSAPLRTDEVGKGTTFTVRLPMGRGPALSTAEGKEK